jgi:thiol-disulfide isomerase/thioredoxin
MKLIIFAALTLSTFTANAQDKFNISGNLTDVGQGKLVLLSYTNSEGKSAKDSAAVVNGKFTISGTTAYGNRAYLELKDSKRDTTKKKKLDFQEFYLEKGNTMVSGKDKMATAAITGTKLQTENLAYHAQMDPLQAEYKKIVERFYKARAAKDSVELKKISAEAKPLMARMDSTLSDFIQKNPDSYLTATLVLENRMAVIDLEKFEPVYNGLSKRVLASFTGRKITDKYNKAKNIAIGKEVDFTLPDTKGNEFKLSSLKGKYVLVDFWASWCVPCRAENPHLLKAYGELKDKNFEIVGVSLDDKREPWLKAVEVDKLPWIQVSDVKGFKTDVAVRFGITAIPQNFLIDPSGKIIAKDLRGEDVNEKIAAYIK